jgi:hypothetical protein
MSSLIFPLRNSAAADTTARRAGGLLIPLRTGGGGASGSVQQRDQEVFKAVAAAVAIADTANALETAADVRTGNQNPGTLFAAVLADPAKPKLDDLVADLRDNRSSASGTPSDQERVVAAAIGANAALVAAAVPRLTDDVKAVAVQWAAAVDADLLERAAHAAAKSQFLETDAETDIKKLQEQVSKLQDDLKASTEALDKRVAALENAGQQQSSKRGGPSPSGG